jgi:hypothetical protein
LVFSFRRPYIPTLFSVRVLRSRFSPHSDTFASLRLGAFALCGLARSILSVHEIIAVCLDISRSEYENRNAIVPAGGTNHRPHRNRIYSNVRFQILQQGCEAVFGGTLKGHRKKSAEDADWRR